MFEITAPLNYRSAYPIRNAFKALVVLYAECAARDAINSNQMSKGSWGRERLQTRVDDDTLLSCSRMGLQTKLTIMLLYITPRCSR